jgi:ribosomal-protein-alanine N-acetyltransferase
LAKAAFILKDFMPNMFLETPRLYIRKLILNDAQALLPIFGDKDVMHFSRAGVMTLDRIKESLTNFYLKSYTVNGFGMYALIQKSDNQLIGICGFFTEEIDGQQHIELAYRLAKKYWGLGFATEAAIALKQYAFEILSIHELISIIAPANIASIRVAEKVGMSLWKETILHDIPVLIYITKNQQSKGFYDER